MIKYDFAGVGVWPMRLRVNPLEVIPVLRGVGGGGSV